VHPGSGPAAGDLTRYAVGAGDLQAWIVGGLSQSRLTWQSVWMIDGAAHWDRIYGSTPSTELSWYAREPAVSLRLVEGISSSPSVAVIDVGAGASLLVDRLVADNFTNVTVLDVSQHALTQVEQRLGEGARHVTFVHDDVLSWRPDRQYDVWHDRAVFHFLTEDTRRDRYVEIAARAIRAGGGLVLATFAEDGPTRCSGLPVSRYSAEDLEGVFSGHFSLVEHEREQHVTPGGVVQPFTWAAFRRA
jgi:2-polyprenyl-3-methyl-5-hydroxy-6-metoxy-1,4-benzoquinol methylase